MDIKDYRPANPVAGNPLKTREDMQGCLLALLEPAGKWLMAEGTRFAAGNHCTCYSADVAALEGWSRLLWGIAPLICGGGSWSKADYHANGFRYGTDPLHAAYWGRLHDCDQRAVEMAAMSLALIIAPQAYWTPLTETQKRNTAEWLYSINERELAKNNWYFFRVLVNLALQLRGCDYDAQRMEEDLCFLESLYSADGWYKDAVPYDNYNPFAFHFYSMIYVAYKSKEDCERCARFTERAKLFARQFIHFFTEEGDFIPYGRSLTYRFAVVSFFSACAFAGVEALPWGQIKGIILRNLRWWFSQPIFDNADLLTVGFAYGSLFHSEQYNAPGSPYWSLKTFLVLALPGSHPFWQAEEEALPALPDKTLLPVPGFLFQRSADDVVFLNAGQYPAFELNNAAAKYAKFAYSARYGFSVSISGWGIDKTGCDSMLFLSERGDGYWRERRASERTVCCEGYVFAVWKPWRDVEIRTWLIPYAGGHIRIHKIDSARDLSYMEGGFSLPLSSAGALGVEKNAAGVLIGKQDNISCIISLDGKGCPAVVEPVANLNELHPRTAVPMLSGEIDKGVHIIARAVYAGRDSSIPELLRGVSVTAGSAASVIVCELPDGEMMRLQDMD